MYFANHYFNGLMFFGDGFQQLDDGKRVKNQYVGLLPYSKKIIELHSENDVHCKKLSNVKTVVLAYHIC